MSDNRGVGYAKLGYTMEKWMRINVWPSMGYTTSDLKLFVVLFDRVVATKSHLGRENLLGFRYVRGQWHFPQKKL